MIVIKNVRKLYENYNTRVNQHILYVEVLSGSRYSYFTIVTDGLKSEVVERIDQDKFNSKGSFNLSSFVHLQDKFYSALNSFIQQERLEKIEKIKELK